MILSHALSPASLTTIRKHLPCHYALSFRLVPPHG